MNRLRMSSLRSRMYLVRLKLLEMGEISAADHLFDEMQPSILTEVDADEKSSKSSKVHAADTENRLKLYEERYNRYKKVVVGKNVDTNIKAKQRKVIDEFQKAAIHIKQCENCGAYTAPFRKDGYTKIFQKPLQKRIKKSVAQTKQVVM